jgi:hypothetical protein
VTVRRTTSRLRCGSKQPRSNTACGGKRPLTAVEKLRRWPKKLVAIGRALCYVHNSHDCSLTIRIEPAKRFRDDRAARKRKETLRVLPGRRTRADCNAGVVRLRVSAIRMVSRRKAWDPYSPIKTSADVTIVPAATCDLRFAPGSRSHRGKNRPIAERHAVLRSGLRFARSQNAHVIVRALASGQSPGARALAVDAPALPAAARCRAPWRISVSTRAAASGGRIPH